MVKEPEPNVVTVSSGKAGLRTEVMVRGHSIIADEPLAKGGTDQGPTPYDLLTAALGTCIAMTLRLYADRKAWPLEGVNVRLRHAKIYEKDCEDCDKAPVGVDRIEREIDLIGPLTDEQRTRLLQIADRCPVKQTLERGVRVVSTPTAAAV